MTASCFNTACTKVAKSSQTALMLIQHLEVYFPNNTTRCIMSLHHYIVTLVQTTVIIEIFLINRVLFLSVVHHSGC